MSLAWAARLTLLATAAAVSISEINGNRFQSPLNGQSLTNISGLVTAKSSSGIFLRSLSPDNDTATSESIYLFSSTVGNSLAVGDVISFDAKVSQYRSTSTYLYLTELSSPANVQVLSSSNAVTPLIIGEDTLNPPTEQFSSLDGGDIYSLPNNVANISTTNPILDPNTYGLDFWRSLLGELVTIRNVTIITRPNSYDETWVTGDWPVTGRSSRGSLTMTDLDSNPEAIIVGDPLDGTTNPGTQRIGDKAADITGVIYYEYGFFYILPSTAMELTTLVEEEVSPTTLQSARSCEAVTIGDYNVENLTPTTSNLAKRAEHIVNYLNLPDLMFIQEIQDNTGSTNDGVVDANVTLTTLVNAIYDISNVTYSFIDIDPVNNEDGGETGGNIRVAYIYRPEVVSLYKPNPGNSTIANEVLSGTSGPELLYNPGLVDPSNVAWDATRKPLAASWIAKGATKPFFTVNVHWSSKGGGSSLQGDARPPINGVVDRRLQQANVTGDFISHILTIDSSAAVITSGDFNEFAFVEPVNVFRDVSGLEDLDDVVGTPDVERYTYVYDMNTQALDHMFVSTALAEGAGYEHVHVNTWATAEDVVSDHDPSIAQLNVCGNA